jgi:hypothetical protein
MGSSSSVPEKIQGTYIEKFKTEPVDNKSTEFSYKLTLKENEFELTQTQTNIERKPEGGGGSFKIAKMALLKGTVEEHEDSKNENEMNFNFKTKSASFQEGGGMMGVPLPDDSHKVDFTMKYTTMMKVDLKTKMPEGTYHSLSFVTFPKLKFEELTGVLTKN